MRNPFGAAIECLRQGAEAHLSNARHWSELNEFGAAETREKMAVEFESAIRVLEAAGKVSERDLGRVHMGFVSSEMRELMEAIRNALPNTPSGSTGRPEHTPDEG